jgi:hypothetical protein
MESLRVAAWQWLAAGQGELDLCRQRPRPVADDAIEDQALALADATSEQTERPVR